MASIDKISGPSIPVSAPALTKQPLSVRFADYFDHLKAHAPALTNRTIWIVAGVVALTLFVLYRLTRATGGTETKTTKLEPTTAEHPPSSPAKTQKSERDDEATYGSKFADGKIRDHARFIEDCFWIINAGKIQYERAQKAAIASSSASVTGVTCSDLKTFLQDEVVSPFNTLVDDVEVGKQFPDKLPNVRKYIDEINCLIKELEIKKDENIDSSALNKVLGHLATAVKTLQNLKLHFPAKAV